MNRRFWAITAILVFVLMTATAGSVLAREDSMEEKSRELDGVYTGAATLSSTSCLAGDCFTCFADNTVQLTRGDGRITILADGPSMTYTPCTSDTAETLRWTITGSYEMTEDGMTSFTLDSCNDGRFPGSGSGTIDGDTISASFSCSHPNSPGSKEEWNNVVLTKQSGGAPSGEGDEAGEGEAQTAEDADEVREGETSGNITVDRLVGDAKVSRLPSNYNKHRITTGPRSKVKISYGDSEIVVGPGSELLVSTANNKFGKPVILWEFLNPEAVIYVKDSLHGTRKEESGVVAGSASKRIFTNLYRSIFIFYNGSYQGREDLSEFYGGETNEPEFSNPETGERSVVVGIKGTEFYFSADGSGRSLFLTDGDVDLYTDVYADAVALAAGSKASVDDTGGIGAPEDYTTAEIDELAALVDLEEEPPAQDDGGLTARAKIAIIAGVVGAVGITMLLTLWVQARREKKS